MHVLCSFGRVDLRVAESLRMYKRLYKMRPRMSLNAIQRQKWKRLMTGMVPVLHEARGNYLMNRVDGLCGDNFDGGFPLPPLVLL
jgi:hypothetical protein